MSQIIKAENFNPIWIYKLSKLNRPRGNQGTRNIFYYKDLITAFDIETTRIKDIEQSIMYVWQWQLGTEYTIIGRTWREFIKLLNSIKDVLQFDEKICIYVHNLSYEFQFLRGIYNFKPEEVFALKSRKILKCEMMGKFEFRCSYLHSNMSLDEYTNKMGAEHKKLNGEEFNYKIMRFPWSPLTEKELEYCQNDVLGLVESLQIEMNFDTDTLYTIPITSTGYVRRDAKNAMRKVSRNFVKEQLLTADQYTLCREAFRGGNTHANRLYSNYIVKDVKSADRSSSYPDVLINCKFPIGKFMKSSIDNLEELLHLIRKRGKATIFRCKIYNLRLINEFWGAPYLAKDKCRNIIKGVYDNGRILKASYIETTLTDIDLEILLSEYDYDDIIPEDINYSRYGKLPQVLLDVIIKYYVSKTELKGNTEQEIYYNKEKNKLNGIYGMMAQDPVKQTIDFINNIFKERKEDISKLLGKSNEKAFLCYQWGVWTTAQARLRLEEGIRLAGDNFVYCDTDSVKYIGVVDWTAYNEERITDSKANGAYAIDSRGIVHYMGVYEQEHDMCEFKTMGAKKYVYRETLTSPLITTIAGVNKKKGGKELEKLGGIEAFKTGTIFKQAGGTDLIYNDIPPMTSYIIDGHILDITSNVVIKDGEYKIGLTEEYEMLLNNRNLYVDN